MIRLLPEAEKREEKQPRREGGVFNNGVVQKERTRRLRIQEHVCSKGAYKKAQDIRACLR